MKTFEQFITEMTNKPELILIIGLPGSGKTTLMNKLNKNNKYIEMDDSLHVSEIQEHLDKKENMIVASGNFCQYPSVVDEFEKAGEEAGYSVKKLYFENDPEKAYKNQEKRGYRIFDYKYFLRSAQHYKIPEGAEIIPINEKLKYKYEVVIPSSFFNIKKFFYMFKDNIDDLSESKTLNELIKKLDKIFEKTIVSFKKAENLDQIVKNCATSGAVADEDKIWLYVTNYTLKSFQDKKLDRIYKSVLDLGHEFIHYNQWHPKNGKINKDLKRYKDSLPKDDPSYKLYGVKPGDDKTLHSRAVDILVSFDDNFKSPPKWIKDSNLDLDKIVDYMKETYYKNPSESIGWAYNAVVDIIFDTYKGSLDIKAKNKNEWVKFFEKLTIENIKKLLKKHWVNRFINDTFKDDKEYQNKFLELMKEMSEKLSNDYYEKIW